jgi:hypothetical protein
VTALATVFRIARSRGADITKEMLGEDFRGFLVVDRWAAYRWVARGMRQLCWAHYLEATVIQGRGAASFETPQEKAGFGWPTPAAARDNCHG